MSTMNNNRTTSLSRSLPSSTNSLQQRIRTQQLSQKSKNKISLSEHGHKDYQYRLMEQIEDMMLTKPLSSVSYHQIIETHPDGDQQTTDRQPQPLSPNIMNAVNQQQQQKNSVSSPRLGGSHPDSNDEDENSRNESDSLLLSTNHNNDNINTNSSDEDNDSNRSNHHRVSFITIGLFGTCTLLLFADQNLMAPNLTAIANDFGITDPIERDVKLGGNIALAFFLIGAPASILFGYYTDHDRRNPCIYCDTSQRRRTRKQQTTTRMIEPNSSTMARSSTTSRDISNNDEHSTDGIDPPETWYHRKYRTLLFCSTICIGEISCFGTGFVTNYTQFLILRSLTGFGMGGAFPILYSLLGDWFTPSNRHIANAILGIGTGFGIAFGQGLAGIIGPTYGWRLPFMLVSIPAIFVAIIIGIFVNDPIRGVMEDDYVSNFEEEISQQLPQQEQRFDVEQQQQQQPQNRQDEDEIHNNDEANNNNHEDQSYDVDQANPMIFRRSGSDHVEMTTLDHYPDDHEIVASANPNHIQSNNMETEQIPVGTRSYKHHDGDDNNQSTHHDSLIYQSSHDDLSRNLDNHDDDHANDDKNAADDNWRQVYLKLFTTPTVIFALLQGGPGCIPWGIVNTYLNDYLSTDLGLSIEYATLVVLLFGIGVFIGQLIGGIFGSYLYRRNHRYPAILAGLSAIIGCIPFYILLHYDHEKHGTWLYVPISIAAGIGSGITGPVIKATLQNVTLPIHRGQAFALFNVTDDFGRGLGPVFVAGIIRMTGSRSRAFSIGTLGWVICGIFNLLIYFFVTKDEARVAKAGHQQQQDPITATTMNISTSD